MKFAATIDSVHYDSKKGAVKIALIATSHMSLDELTTLSPSDEPIQVTLESEQAKIGVFTPNAIIDEEAAVKLKEAADRLREGSEEEENAVNLKREIKEV